jgi:DNA-binding transcriptional LysR family regulator
LLSPRRLSRRAVVIEKLTYFVALAREQSFRRAAEACGVAQPTLSAAIKQLEEELGVMLVRRSSRVHGLTPEGEKVLEWARRIVGDARGMRQELQAMREGLSGHVRMAVIPTALAVVPRLTAACRRRHPALEFTILSCASTQILERLDNLEVDVGITYLNNEALGRVRSQRLYTERYLLITADPALFAGRAAVSWGELGDVPLCLLTPDMQNRRILDRLMRNAGVTPRAAIESNSQITLVAHVLSGQCAAVLPEQATLMLAFSERLRCLPIGMENSAAYDVGLVLLDRDPLPLLAAAVLSEAQRVFMEKVG